MLEFGTPDLFLYAQNRLTKEIEYIRFVEKNRMNLFVKIKLLSLSF